MPLISCPDCGKQISTEAVACPGCGRPVKGLTQPSSPGGGSRPMAQPIPIVVKPVKSRGVFVALGLFLGCLGIHNFYAGYYGRGAVQLIITLVLGWVIIGIVITALWALIELFTVRVDAEGNAMA